MTAVLRLRAQNTLQERWSDHDHLVSEGESPVMYMPVVVLAALAALAGVAAAILPSRRAAKLNILRAIVSE